jgi:hypothetical protein
MYGTQVAAGQIQESSRLNRTCDAEWVNSNLNITKVIDMTFLIVQYVWYSTVKFGNNNVLPQC